MCAPVTWLCATTICTIRLGTVDKAVITNSLFYFLLLNSTPPLSSSIPEYYGKASLPEYDLDQDSSGIDAKNDNKNIIYRPLPYFHLMNDEKNDRFNGVNTQVLNTVYDSIRNQPEMAKATFSVKSEWNGMEVLVLRLAPKPFVLVVKI